jgi:hypothetical protein
MKKTSEKKKFTHERGLMCSRNKQKETKHNSEPYTSETHFTEEEEEDEEEDEEEEDEEEEEEKRKKQKPPSPASSTCARRRKRRRISGREGRLRNKTNLWAGREVEEHQPCTTQQHNNHKP